MESGALKSYTPSLGSIIKRPRKRFSSTERLMVMNVYNQNCMTWPKNPRFTITDCVGKTADMMGLSVHTVLNIVRERNRNTKLTTRNTMPESEQVFLDTSRSSTLNASTLMAPDTSLNSVATSEVNKEVQENTSLEECRACLQKIDKQSVRSLFEKWFTPWAVRGAIIVDDLSKFADVEISETDQFSKVICPKCYQQLSNACTFMITVQMSDSILRQRVEDSNLSTTNEVTSWPQPILLNNSVNRDRCNSTVEVEVKQEVLSEEENVEDVAEMDQNWEPTMDIKIEPEEITAPVQSNVQINGDVNYESADSMGCSSKCDVEEFLDTTVKQEIPSGEEFMDDSVDMPLDCILCYKVFNTISGLKAHVISDHSYKTVKRKTENSPSPVKAKIHVQEHSCDSCDQSFATSTDLMVHRATHSGHVCFACDRKFTTFQQLTRHGPRCQKKSRLHTRPPPRPAQLIQLIKNNIKGEKKRQKESENNSESPSIESMVAKRVQEMIKSWSSSEGMDSDSQPDKSENNDEGDEQQEFTKEHLNLELVKDKSAEEILGNSLSSKEIKEESIKIEIGPLVGNMQELDPESKHLLPKVEIEKSVQRQPEDRVSKSNNQENGVSEPNIQKTEIENTEDQSQQNSSYHPMEIEHREEIRDESQESQFDTLNKDCKSKLLQDDDSSSENTTSISCNPLENANQDSSNSKPIDDNSLNSVSVSSLPNKDLNVVTNISVEQVQESIESLQDARIDYPLPEEIEPTNTENTVNNGDISEEKAPTINKMEVHLEINPLDKDSMILETEIKDVECEKSETCEPKLVSVISEPSDI